MKSLVLFAALFAALLPLNGNVQASESLSFRCNLGDQFVFVQIIPEEGRAVLEDAIGNTILVPDGRGGYFNDGEEISFDSDVSNPVLWLGDVSHRCELNVPGAAPGQAQAGGAAGGRELRMSAQGRSLGGKLREGPGVNFRQTGSLPEGTPVTILANTGMRYDGYDWFEVATDSGKRGYHWGGIMCSTGQQVAGIFEQCGSRQPILPAQPSGAVTRLNVQGQSLGGKLRGGPGTNFRQVGSLREGTWVTILKNTGVRFNGYDWFEVATDSGLRGFQWGGIMCSNGLRVAGIFGQCGMRGTAHPAGNLPTGPGGGWMAFALGPNGTYGHGAAATKEGAEQLAVNYCGGAGCRIADTTQARCHALALSPGSSGIGAGASEQAAQSFAVGWCSDTGATNCRIEYTYCQ